MNMLNTFSFPSSLLESQSYLLPQWAWLLILLGLILLLVWAIICNINKEEVKINPLHQEESHPTKEDDLQMIEGIGPKISQVFHEAGISTFEALAQSDPETLKKHLDNAGIRLGDPTTWPEQAQLAAEGKWEELQALQDKLKGGREV